MGARLRCTVRSLGPRKPPARLKPVLLKLIEELLKRTRRRSGPLRHSLLLVVQKKRRGQAPPDAPDPGRHRRSASNLVPTLAEESRLPPGHPVDSQDWGAGGAALPVGWFADCVAGKSPSVSQPPTEAVALSAAAARGGDQEPGAEVATGASLMVKNVQGRPGPIPREESARF